MQSRDIIIVGAGMAALVTALTLAKEMNVKLYTKDSRYSGNSWRAQGGMAVSIHPEDQPLDHLDDTLVAGCFHNDLDQVTILVQEGVERVKKWMNHGMTFDCDPNGHLSLGMEGAHGRRRILHAGGDQTGKKWMSYLYERITSSSNITVFEKENVIELVCQDGKCKGVIVQSETGNIKQELAEVTILASGGCGGIFNATSNDPSIVGDGIVMAYRAGATLSDMEFLQFHPTLIKKGDRVIGLASEALRGEGAILINESGIKIMDGIHPQKDLAPRDVVARVIEEHINKGETIYLEVSRIKDFPQRFPTIYKMCEDSGIAIKLGRIPVVVGAHFLMGGVVTDAYGQTTIPQLYAVGEVARTGVHGANRLASNSLLEALVFGERAGEHILENYVSNGWTTKKSNKHHFEKSNSFNIAGVEAKLPEIDALRERASQVLGVQRHEDSMKKLVQWLEKYEVKKIINANRIGWTKDAINRSTMLVMVWLMAKSALERTESRGAHYRTDYPNQDRLNWQGKQVIRNVQRDTMMECRRGQESEQAIT